MNAERPTYLAVGHVSHDVGDGGQMRVGGTVSYAALMAWQLGWRPIIVTSAGPDFRPPECLRHADWHIVPALATTCFQNTYHDGRRRQHLRSQAACLRPHDIPERGRNSTLVHLAPVAQEIEPCLASAWSASPLVITPQGWFRRWDREGLVVAADWQPATLPRRPLAMVLSVEDMEGCRTCRAREIARWTDVLVLTEAAGGCTIYAGNACVHVSALPATPVDPTGAGDVFAAAFFIRFWETRDALVAADFATTAAGLSVTGRGLESVPDRQAILRLQSSRRSPSAVKSQTP